MLLCALALTACRRNNPSESTPAKSEARSAVPAKTPEQPPASGPVFTTGEMKDGADTGPMNFQNYDLGPKFQPAPVGDVKYVESERGPPEIIGCADGQREAFADVKKFPDIAGCVGNWASPQSLDAKPVGVPCGDDIPIASPRDGCKRPADACASGWHVCGSTDENYKDLLERISADDCDNAGPGRFNAALSHNPDREIDPCIDPEEVKRGFKFLPCQVWGRGSEPVCCGSMCEFGLCKDGVWPGRTRISRGLAEGCGDVDADHTPGLLCCSDPGSTEPDAL